MEPDKRSDFPACLLCGRAYTGAAHPRWAFTPQGDLAGTAHTGCSFNHGDRQRYVYAPVRLTVADARALAWIADLRPRDGVGSDESLAASLFSRGRDRLLNGEQVALLRHWRSNAGAAHVTAHYHGLLREYAAWDAARRRAAQPPPPAERAGDEGRPCADGPRDDAG